MSIIKAAQAGARIGEVAGPEGELIGLGLGAAASFVRDVVRNYNRARDVVEASPEELQGLFRSRPGVEQVHPTLRQRRPQPQTPTPTPAPNQPRVSRPRILHRPRSAIPITSGIVATGIATGLANLPTVVASPSNPVGNPVFKPGPNSPQGPSPYSSPPETPNGPLEYMPRVHRMPHQSAAPSEPHFTPLNLPRDPFISGSRPQIDYHYVGDYRFPQGPYNYETWERFTRNNTLFSLQ